jgi:hypothetical protein
MLLLQKLIGLAVHDHRLFNWMQLQVNDNSAGDGPSSLTNAGDVAEDEDDDELEMDELDELEASLSKTSLQIQEPGTHS